MGDVLQPSIFGPAGGKAASPLPHDAGLPPYTSFNRQELSLILSLYGAKVATGEWRDYSVDFLKDTAIFSVFQRASDRAIYRIEKSPKLAKRQGAYSVVATTGLILKRGHDLAKVLRVLDKKLHIVKA